MPGPTFEDEVAAYVQSQVAAGKITGARVQKADEVNKTAVMTAFVEDSQGVVRERRVIVDRPSGMWRHRVAN